MQRIHRLLTWPAALAIAFIFLWYEQFKLTGNQGSVDLFTTITDWLYLDGHEKAFRLTVATGEIIAAILVVIPATRLYGAALSLGIISGAIFFHIFSPLGIDPYHDGGTLFKEAVFVWICSVFILLAYRVELMLLAHRWIGTPRPAASA
ncbi:MAG: hypothetical protein AB7O80_03855 [Acetobacteraceae bacterium]